MSAVSVGNGSELELITGLPNDISPFEATLK